MEERTERSAAVAKPRSRPALPRARIARRRGVTEELWAIWVEPEIPFTFKPGQYCTLGVDGIERAYSIASAPHEEYLEIFIELIPLPDGELTPLLYPLQVGETVSIRPRPKGIFTLDPGYQSHLLVATVTGVAPFVSYIRDFLHGGGEGQRFYILMGASYMDEFAYDQELQELARTSSDAVAFVPTVSRPQEARNAGWKGETGRVNTIVGKYIQAFGLDKESTLIYACGHPGMIEDVKTQFQPEGFKVKEERFWKQ